MSSFFHYNEIETVEALSYQAVELTLTTGIRPIYKLNQTKWYDISRLVSYRDNACAFLPILLSVSPFYGIELLHKARSMLQESQE